MYQGMFSAVLDNGPMVKSASRYTKDLRATADLATKGGLGLGLGIAGAGLGGLGGLLAAGGHEVFINENPLLDKDQLKLKGFGGGRGLEFGVYEPGSMRTYRSGRVGYRDMKDLLSPERMTKLRDLAAVGGAGGGLAGMLAGARGGIPSITRKNVAKAVALGVPLGALGLAAGTAGGNLAGQLLEGPVSFKNMGSVIEDGGLRITKGTIKSLDQLGTTKSTGKLLQALGGGAGLGGGLGVAASLSKGNLGGRLAADMRSTAKGFKTAPISSSLKALAAGVPLGLAGAGLGGLAGNASAHGLEAYLHPETFDEIGSKVEKALANPRVLNKKPLLDFFVPKSYEIGRPTVSALTYGGAGLGGLAGLA